MSTGNPETALTVSRFADFSLHDLKLVAETAAEVQVAIDTLPEGVSVADEILRPEIDARTQALARAAGALVVAEVDTPEREVALDEFKIAMDSLGLAGLLAGTLSGPLHERFRSERIKRGFTQKQVADQMGVTPAYISRIESGERKTEVTDARLSTFFENGQFDLIPKE